MTSVMLATYPEVFAGGAIVAGLPLASPTMSQAFNGMFQSPSRPARELGDLVRNASSHKGSWPKLSVWHGSADKTVNPSNASEIVTSSPSWDRQDHRALIATREELLSRVPSHGLLNEEDCILVAIANSPVLQKRRAAIQGAVADRRKEQDWDNPELRLSYGSQSDDFLRNPYVENSVENFNSTEDRTADQSTTSLANPGEFGFGESTTDHETGTTTTTRYREIERIVVPGRFGDTVTANIYETRTDGGTTIRERTVGLNGFEQTRRDQLEENVERVLHSSSTETTSSSAENGNQETFSALVRFRMPNFAVKKAKLARAAAEIMLAGSQYLADEDKLVREVRAIFQDLAVRESTYRAQVKRRANFSAFRTEMEGEPIAEFIEENARVSINMADVPGRREPCQQ